ncbi:hypothetical protein [Halopiger xanaduensis]|uniref:Uncharacterized protein n=1 Tax=Halopiger xanaduensis (strain DSM 18323 / JCM 14033 / SH-6) TaxID=797210 RepID=F8D6I5_HALXS|nr:hypothetical protein [Halopiger xanaduensis]AEH36574.1 hypothetical protein Halxa_1947 [Halopiger xanaduensis SH-6]
MNQTDPSARAEPEPEPESAADTARTAAKRGREYVSRATSPLRRGVESGTVTAIIGGAGLLSGVRALVAGDRERGLNRLILGAGFVGAAIGQRRSYSRGEEPPVEQSDVGDTRPDVGAIDEAGGVGTDDRAAGDAAADVADTSPTVEDVGSGLESEPDLESTSVDQREIADTGVDSEDLTEATDRETGAVGTEEGTSDESTAEEGADAGDSAETEAIDRLGEAALDRQSREVPAPQRAFNQGYLAHSSEAFWGIRDRDDGVLVAVDFDAIQGRDGVDYVASSEIGADVRELPIPDAVLDHWDGVFGGGTAVAGGDDILFVTTDELATDGLLRILPAAWADDLSPSENR